MNHKRLTVDKEYWVILDFVMGIAYMFFVNFYSHVSHAAIIDRMLSILIAISFALFLGIMLIYLLTKKKDRIFILGYVLILLAVFGFSQFFFPENNEVFRDNFTSFILNIFRLTVLLYLIEDYSRFNKWLSNYSICISLFLLYQFFFKGLVFNNGIYSMALGYIILFPTIILVSSYIRERKIIFLVGTIINVFIILLYASRGPLLCLALFICFSLLRNSKPYIIIIAAFFIILLYMFFDQIVQSVLTLIPSVQLSRTLMYFIQNRAGDDSGRMGMYQRIISEIARRPFIIRGINSDYHILGVYTHNIIIELLYEFGLILGGIIVVDIIYKVIVTYFESKNDIYWQTCFVFMMIAVPELMVSNTLWREWTFWAWIVIFIKCRGGNLFKQILIKTKRM